ncbi:MAG TPA: HEAT repeat domain-containing protein [Planctomycetota bacterium]|nr:HEAT repeat domain-containing protein [Planctomycetota bacterium]
MGFERRTVVVLAALAVVCAGWALAVDGGRAGLPEFTPFAADPVPDPVASPAPPDPARPGSSGPREPEPESDAALAEALGTLLDSPAGQPPGAAPGAAGRVRGYRESGLRILGERSRREIREAAWKELEPLLAEFRAAGPGSERAEILKRMSVHLRLYLGCGGSLEYLGLLAESAESGATHDERKRAVIAVHTLWQPEIVDFLEARAASPHREVRFYAVEGFAWVTGDERPRALANLVRGLEDPDGGVRAVAALSLGMVVADPAHAPALVGRLVREEDPGAARTIVRAVLELDPEGGEALVRTAAPGASSEIWGIVEAELARGRGRTAAK